ncbi:MAG: glycosyltransferase family 4 protein [Candidatus Pacearchaeota archaeon]|nr:glycosyltransferase family 4 protein [Candidatus Pacearchaeota archaeon]
MKILEICPFSAGGCGVWARAKYESVELTKLGHKVAVFSSNIEKGTNKILNTKDKREKIEIFRFPAKKYPFSENVLHFNFQKQLEIFSPDLVITHLLHPHSFEALKICKKLNIPIFMVTHAPFNVKRNFFLNILTKIWNYRLKLKLKQFDKIITITNWETKYLRKFNLPENKTILIPNGIRKKFFTEKQGKEKKQILYCGRISPVKNIETLIKALYLLKDKSIKLKLLGKVEPDYLPKLKNLITKLKLQKQIELVNEVYNINDQISALNESKIFALPSLREAMPQVLIEAMSRAKIVISSNTDGGKEIIENKKNGYLFQIGNSEELAKLIKENIKGNKKIQEQAKKDSKKYPWEKLIKKYEKLIEECYQ